MASGQDLRITDVPFSNLPATTATVFINDNGKLRQTDLTTVAKNSELRTMILDAHQTALDDIHATHGMHTEEWERIHDHTLDDFQRASDQHIQTLDDKLNTSSNELSQLIEAGHEKLQDDIKVVDELCAYAATVRETTFEKNAQLMPTVSGNVIIGSVKAGGYQKQLSGKNKLQNIATTQTVNGVTFTVNDDKSVTLVGTSTDAATVRLHNTLSLAVGTYTFSLGNYLENTDCRGELRVNHSDGTYNFVYVTTKDITFNIAEGDTINFVAIVAYASRTFNRTIYPMISLEGGEYEPYCGGTASPNPSFPQTIHSTGDSGWFDGEWVKGYLLSGAVSTSNNNTVTSKNYIPCKEGDTVNLAYVSKEMPLKSSGACMQIAFYDETQTAISSEWGTAPLTALEVSVPSNAVSFRFTLYFDTDLTISQVGHVSVTINGQYAVIVDEVGKNLLPNNYYGVDVATGNGLTMTRQSDGTLVINGTSTAVSTYRYAYDVVNQDILKKYIGKTVTSSVTATDTNVSYVIAYVKDGVATTIVPITNKAVSFVVPNYDELRVYLRIANGVTLTNAIASLQIELGETATEYTPYQHNRTYIPISEPLRSIPNSDVADELHIVDGEYKAYRRCAEWVPDDSINIGREAVDGSRGYRIVISSSTLASKGYKSDNVANIRCTHYITLNAHQTYGHKNGISANVAGKLLIWDDNYPEGTSDYKTWLLASGMKIVYELAEPYYEDLDQTPFYNLLSYDDVTNVSIVGLHENLTSEVTVMYPSTPSGALLVNAYADSKVLNQKLDEEVALRTRQLSITKGTLTAGVTSVVIEDEKITKDSLLTFYTSIYSVSPVEVVVDNGSVTLMFDAQETDMEVGVQVNG